MVSDLHLHSFWQKAAHKLSSYVPPIVWWIVGRRLGFHEGLVDAAFHLLSSAVFSAGLERLFSSMRLTYGTLRTQLGVEKAGKLAFLYPVLNK